MGEKRKREGEREEAWVEVGVWSGLVGGRRKKPEKILFGEEICGREGSSGGVREERKKGRRGRS